MARQVWDANSNQVQQSMNNAGAGMNTGANANYNPMAAWQQMTNNVNNVANGMNTMNQWNNMFQQWSNMWNMDNVKNMASNWNSLYNQYVELIQSNWSKMNEGIQNGTAADAYRNMISANDGFARFYQMWMPMMKSIQEKTFNMEVYNQMMNPAAYKELMDKYLGMMPEGSRQYVQQMTQMMQEGMKNMTGMGTQGYQQMRDFMGQAIPGMNAKDGFAQLLNTYNQMYSQMHQAAAPFTTMMTPNAQTKGMIEWQDIANRAVQYHIRNAELQYMMYQQGVKVMDALANNVAEKIKSGVEVSSIMGLYQEWMNLSDKTYVSLFESEEYSQLMAEVSGMQLKLKKDIELQMEKLMVGIPVATRSEMDELYKTIYDLKKTVRDLERGASGNKSDIPAGNEQTAPVTDAATAIVNEAPSVTTPDNGQTNLGTEGTARKTGSKK
jgi:hypothetical protein